MRPRLRLAAIALLLTLAAPAALAQEGPLRVEVEPSNLTTTQGVAANATIHVHNNGIAPILVRLSTLNATGNLSVAFDDPELDVLPGGNATTSARVTSSQVGTWSVVVRARERTGVGANANVHDDATLTLTVRASANATGGNATNTTNGSTNETLPPPPPEEEADANATAPPDRPAPPLVNLTQVEIRAARGDSAPVRVPVHNPASVAQDVNITMRLPLGWAGSLAASRITIPPGATLDARGSVVPTAQAGDAEGELEIRAAGGIHIVRLLLRVDEPAPAEDARASQQPPSEHVLVDEGAPVDEPPVAPPPVVRAIPTLRVEPREVGAAPGTSVVLTLYIANAGDAALTGRARVDVEPLDASVADPDFTAPPRDEASVTFIVTIPPEVPLGSSYDGLASIAFDLDPAIFTIHVQTGDPVLLAQVVHHPGPPTWIVWTLAGVGALAAGAAAASRKWPLLGLAPLYARLAPRRALEHPRRAAMLALLKEEPGLTLADVQRRLGLSNGVARHHLALLEAAGALRSVPDGALRRLWPMGAAKAEAVPALRERALAMLVARGAMRASDLATELGVSRQLLHYHVRKLEADGRIATRRAGAEIVLEPR